MPTHREAPDQCLAAVVGLHAALLLIVLNRLVPQEADELRKVVAWLVEIEWGHRRDFAPRPCVPATFWMHDVLARRRLRRESKLNRVDVCGAGRKRYGRRHMQGLHYSTEGARRTNLAFLRKRHTSRKDANAVHTSNMHSVKGLFFLSDVNVLVT